MNKWPSILSALGLSLGLASAADAALKAVDPGPYTLATGRFPMWYQDNNDRKLELCQSRALSSRVASAPGAPSYMCTLLPEPGVYDDAQPMVFPDNWPPEMFWMLAEASIPAVGNSGYELDAYVAGIEAAFAAENPVDGDQQSFARIRIRVSVPQAGTYTITHPYGEERITVTTPGRRAINVTRDIGIGAPGDFSGALGGQVGPFLQSVNGPYTEINPDTGASETFVGDPNLTEAVIGSPLNTNFVRISGPAGTIQTNLFTLSGKVFDERQQTAVEIQRSSYSRNAGGTRYEVFASAPGSAALCMRDTLTLVPGTPPSLCQVNLTSDNNGRFFAKHDSGGATLPAFLVVTASDPTGTTKPTSISRKLVDLVKISTARYAWDTHTLTVEASSSDQVVVPDLVAEGFGRLSKTGTLQRLTVSELAQPPASVTIKSSAGGSDSEPVTVVGKAPAQQDNQAPLAVADHATTAFNAPVQINLLANDSDPDNDTPLTVVDLVQPAAGTGSVTLAANGVATYTPPPGLITALNAVFSYRAQDARGKPSEPATVTVSVTANQVPLAGNDSGTVNVGQTLTLNVLANDSDPDNHAPLSVANLTQPPTGQGSVTTNGTSITYTPPLNLLTPLNVAFTYQARDAFGALSAPATVNVQVTPLTVPENLVISAATVTVRVGNRFTWDISGTTSAILANSIRVTVTTPTGPVLLGTATVPITGRWRLNVTSTTVAPSANPSVEVRSALNNVRTATVLVQ
ncbi:Ig-like domain-containing protein [Pseudomonas citronellolis]|uniref:Ig-like domain-containing protein n=1 Tax=Pseudomonas citronellolis TaxID=53408 RepID=UPI0023E364DA|nr:Ig-like domain-containing protein [Pseudomonas citronellolis]MDF3935230.1 Ig-like domain-containing protein [Pseudomonas citronellolis]